MSNRLHIKGLDKPAAQALRLAADPRGVLRTQAGVHERHRLETVAETLALTGLMTAKKVLTGREVVTVAGAVFQFGKGVRADATVAAHCLPGQLEFNAWPIHAFADWNMETLRERGMKPLPLSSKLCNLSGRTDVVDVAVNHVDSALEIMDRGRGLKPLFGRAASQLLELCLRTQPSNLGGVKDLAGKAMHQYRLSASYACEERLANLAAFAPTDGESLENIQRKMIVAEEYLQVVRDGSFVPDAITSSGFDDLVKDVIA
jgi:hypothetical protein